MKRKINPNLKKCREVSKFWYDEDAIKKLGKVGVLDVTKDKTEVARFIWKNGKYVRVKP